MFRHTVNNSEDWVFIVYFEHGCTVIFKHSFSNIITLGRNSLRYMRRFRFSDRASHSDASRARLNAAGSNANRRLARRRQEAGRRKVDLGGGPQHLSQI